MPWWVSILQMAEKWGTPPWKLTGDEDELLWYHRQMAFDKAVDKGYKQKDQHPVD